MSRAHITENLNTNLFPTWIHSLVCSTLNQRNNVQTDDYSQSATLCNRPSHDNVIAKTSAVIYTLRKGTKHFKMYEYKFLEMYQGPDQHSNRESSWIFTFTSTNNKNL